jgi:hypothetical protein
MAEAIAERGRVGIPCGMAKEGALAAAPDFAGARPTSLTAH